MKSKNIVKKIALVMAFCLLFTCFAGCGDKKTDTSSSNPSSVAADASSVDDASSDDTSTTEESSSDTASTGTTTSTGNTTSTSNTTSTGKNPNTTSNTTSNKTSTSQTTSTAPVVTEPKSINDVIDFFVDVPAGREPVILQFTDPQTIDPTTETGKKNGVNATKYAPSKRYETIYKYMDETVEKTKPDLILVTGDLTYGKYDDDGNCLTDLIKEMEKYKIPWAPVYGNHEAESLMGIDWYSKQLEKAEYCLFKQNQYYNGKVLTGNGNYTVGIRQGGKVTRVFFMMDSNGYDAYSKIKVKNDHSTGTIGMQADQMNWFKSQTSYIKKFAPNAKLSAAFHIQLSIFRTVLDERYDLANQGKTGPFQINLNEDSKRNEKDFGYINIKPNKAWDTNNSVFNTFKNAGVDSIFVGHVHRANVGIYYQGIYLVFGQKTGTHEEHNVMTADGRLVSSISGIGTPQVGGTVMKISTSGDITSMYNYICEK